MPTDKTNIVWKIISFLFNPLLIPLYCAMLYYLLTPYPFFRVEVVYTCSVIAAATLVIPLPVLFLLKIFGKIENLSLRHTYERRLPLLMVILLMGCAVYFYLSGRVSPAISLAMGAATVSLIAAYLSLWADKISLHAMGMSGMVAFAAMLLLKWNAPALYALSVILPLAILYDLVVMARMEQGCHSIRQILLGTLAGALPQALAFLWLYNP